MKQELSCYRPRTLTPIHKIFLVNYIEHYLIFDPNYVIFVLLSSDCLHHRWLHHLKDLFHLNYGHLHSDLISFYNPSTSNYLNLIFKLTEIYTVEDASKKKLWTYFDLVLVFFLAMLKH